MTSEELFRLTQKPGYGISSSTRANVKPLCEIPDAEPEHHAPAALVGTAEGEETGIRRIAVRFVGYRVRPLDPDNFAGSVKDLLDGLRHASLIPGDEPWRITLETEQVKVSHFRDERTTIELFS